MLVALIVLVILREVTSHELLYSEMEYFGGSCYPWDSCKPPRIESEDHLWGNHSCECGEHCIRYGTCCADSPHFGKILHVQYRGETCKKLTSVTDAVIMVSRCPDRWRNGLEILNKCLTPNEDNMKDPVMMTPVTSLETHVTYKNYFCAVCNYDYRNIYSWSISMELKTKETILQFRNITEKNLLENMIYNTDEKSWGFVKDDQFYKLNLRFKIPERLQKLVKKCYQNTVSICRPSYANNNTLQYKCMSYYSPIKIKEDGRRLKKYRNIHCAICNDANVTDSNTNKCKLDFNVPKKFKPSFSFALLLDINKDDGEYVGLKKFCSEGQKWDPFFKKCRSLACALPGFVVRNGKCVPYDAIETR